MTSLDWNELQAALSALECDVSPAGLHGQLAAIACRSDQLPSDLGLDTSTDDAQGWATLREFAQQTRQQLESEGLEFSPLMPGDEQMLWRRLEALAEWAECFAFGLSLNGSFEPKQLSEDAQECLQHLLDLSRLDPDDPQASGAEAEQAFTELVEFLRVAVMTLYVEFRIPNAKPSHPLH